MTDKFRIISFDCGNHHTGVGVADIIPGREFKLIHVNLHVDHTKNMVNSLIAFIKMSIENFVTHQNCIVVYERLLYKNYNLMRIQNKLRDYFKSISVKTMTLTPKQKSGKIGGKGKERKEKAVAIATDLLMQSDLSGFERIHDIADAVLSAHYLYEHPEKIKGLKNKA